MISNRLANSPILAFSIGLLATLWLLVSLRFSPPVMAAILGAPFVLAAFMHRPAWGLLSLFFFLPYISAFEVKVVTLGFNLGLPFLLGGLWFLESHIQKRETKGLPASLTGWFVLFVLWTLVCSLLSDRPTSGLLQTSRWMVLFGFSVLLWNIWGRRFQERALNLYLLAIIPIAGYALWQVYTVGLEQIMFGRTVSLTPQRLSSIYVNPNTLGLVMAFGFLFMLAKLMARRGWFQTFERTVFSCVVVVGTLFFLSGLILSFSRSSWLFALIGALVLAWTIPLLRLLSLAGLAGSSLFLLFGPLPPWLVIGLRLGSGASDRNELWKAAARILEENPWTGLGPGHGVFEAYRPAFMDSMVERTLDYVAAGGAHNVFLNNAASLGWIGLLLTVLVFVLILKRVPQGLRAYRQGHWVAGAAAATVVGLFARGFFESGTTIGHGQLNDTLVFLFCALVLMHLEDQSEAPRLVISPAEIRSLRTGGHRFWVSLVDALHKKKFPVVEAPQSPPLGRGALPAMVWNTLWLGGFKRGVLFVDSSSHGRLGLVLRLVRMRSQVRIITVVHHLRDEFALAQAWYARLARWNESWVLRISDSVVVHSEHEALEVEKRGVASHRITQIKLGTDRPENTMSVEPREGKPLRLLWVGGDFKRKDMPTMLTALSQVPEAHLTVVGTPSDTSSLQETESIASSLNLKHRVQFRGTLSTGELAQCWHQHDIFVSPSRQEGHGMAVDEALAYGMPTVLSDLEVFRQRLPEESVVFVPVGDPNRLAAALKELRPLERREELHRQALAHAERFPTWEQTYEAYLNLTATHWSAVVAASSEAGTSFETPGLLPNRSQSRL